MSDEIYVKSLALKDESCRLTSESDKDDVMKVSVTPGDHVALHSQTLIERYAEMAHSFERRRIDSVLRGMDFIVASMSLLLLGPLMLLIASALRLSGGPSFYRGKRVGRAGVIFTMYKFRTLTADAEQRLGPYYGPELTRRTKLETSRLGTVLRATKLDELPQLYNVLLGQMSVVGPRPIRPTFFEELSESIPQYWQRLVVRPGITGYAQLRLTREMSWAEKLAHDFEYIADRSLPMYIAICIQTVGQTLWRAIKRTPRVER